MHITRLDLVRLNLWALFRLRANLIFLAVVAVGVFVYLTVSRTPATPTAWAIVVFSSLAGALVGLLAGFVVSLVCILLSSSQKAGVLGKHIYTVTEQGLHEKTEANETTQKWSGIQSLHKSRSYLFIRVNSFLFHLIPKRALSSEEEFEEFWSKADAYWKQAA